VTVILAVVHEVCPLGHVALIETLCGTALRASGVGRMACGGRTAEQSSTKMRSEERGRPRLLIGDPEYYLASHHHRLEGLF
jgi:hypothetical protein